MKPSPAMLELLLAQSQDDDARVRRLAIRTMGYLGATTSAKFSLDHVKVVHNDLSDADIEIVPIKSHSSDYVRVVYNELNDAEVKIESSKVHSLKKTELLDGFWVLTKDSNALARFFALRDLRYLGDEAATPTVMKRLATLTQDADEAVRESALRTFGQLGQTAAMQARLKRRGWVSGFVEPA